jgi:hypothetical protein
VVAGFALSSNGDVTGNHGSIDMWVVKLAANGTILWQKTLGGSGEDGAYAITASGDGGFVVAGYTNSTDGNVTGAQGVRDMWVVKLAANGAILWQKTLGGSDADGAYAITASGDGGFVVAGYTFSNDKDVTGNQGNSDYWVVKLDAAGTKVWQKNLGGSGQDLAQAITASRDGGFVVAGQSRSTDGDITGAQGDNDMWVVKLNAAGTILWQKALGGSSQDVAQAITASEDGGFVVAGYTQSNDKDVTGNQGSADYWVVKLDSAGTKVWQKTLGGSDADGAYAITASGDGGFVVAGQSRSTDGDVTGAQGDNDYWVVKLDAAGTILWQKTLGGSGSDIANAITASGDGGFIVAGTSQSNDGDVTGVHGIRADYWVVKLGAPAPTVTNLSATPNPVCAGQSVQFTATIGGVTGTYNYTFTNGAAINQQNTYSGTPFSQTITASGSGSQTFTLRVSTAGGASSAVVMLVVNGLPNAGFTGLAPSYCANASPVSLSPASSGGTFSGPGVSGTTFNPAQAGTGGTISYVVTQNGCTNSSSQSVTVTPLPNASFSGLAPSYCAHASPVSLSPTTPGGTFSGPGVSGTTFTPAQAGTGGTVSYSVTANGCSNTSSQSVTVVPLPSATLSNNGPLTNTNPTVTLTASGGTSYAFSAGATQPGGGNTATVNAPGPYSVTVTSQGCSATASTTVTGAISQSSCRNGTAIITVVYTGTPIKYEWYRNSINSARLTENPAQVRGTSTSSLTLVNQQVTADYYVRVTDANGSAVVYGPFRFTVNLNCNIYARQGAQEVELRISVLGNPIQGEQLRATINGAEGKALNVQLLDLSGKPIHQQSWPQAQTQQAIEWQLGGQASGVYLLQATTPDKRQSLKVIKP